MWTQFWFLVLDDLSVDVDSVLVFVSDDLRVDVDSVLVLGFR